MSSSWVPTVAVEAELWVPTWELFRVTLLVWDEWFRELCDGSRRMWVPTVPVWDGSVVELCDGSRRMWVPTVAGVGGVGSGCASSWVPTSVTMRGPWGVQSETPVGDMAGRIAAVAVLMWDSLPAYARTGRNSAGTSRGGTVGAIPAVDMAGRIAVVFMVVFAPFCRA
jgi:hypothetical protein